jgi:hypothetical protein
VACSAGDGELAIGMARSSDERGEFSSGTPDGAILEAGTGLIQVERGSISRLR